MCLVSSWSLHHLLAAVAAATVSLIVLLRLLKEHKLMCWAGMRIYCLVCSIKLLRWSHSRAISFPFSCFEINSLSPMEFQLSALWLDPVTLLKTVGFFSLLFFPLINFFLIFFFAISLTDELAEVQKTQQHKTKHQGTHFPLGLFHK